MTDQTAAERARQRHLDRLLEAEAQRVQEETLRKVAEMKRAMEDSMRRLLGR